MTANAVRRMKIDVTSDVICPFCLLGMAQLEQAITKFRAQHSGEQIEFDIRLLPYQLNGLLSDTPEPRKVYGTRKFGEARWAAMTEGMKQKFAAVGLSYNADGMTSSSHLAHRLQTYALSEHPDRQLALAMDIFRSFHCDGIAPSDKPTLAALATKHGIFPSAAEATAFLDGKDCDEEVKRAYMVAHKLGVTGVPFFVFQDKYAASGAMGTDEFVSILEEITKREAPKAVSGSTCDPIGKPSSAAVCVE